MGVMDVAERTTEGRNEDGPERLLSRGGGDGGDGACAAFDSDKNRRPAMRKVVVVGMFKGKKNERLLVVRAARTTKQGSGDAANNRAQQPTGCLPCPEKNVAGSRRKSPLSERQFLVSSAICKTRLCCVNYLRRLFALVYCVIFCPP